MGATHWSKVEDDLILEVCKGRGLSLVDSQKAHETYTTLATVRGLPERTAGSFRRRQLLLLAGPPPKKRGPPPERAPSGTAGRQPGELAFAPAAPPDAGENGHRPLEVEVTVEVDGVRMIGTWSKIAAVVERLRGRA